ncbi:arginine ABC transporter ATP-binding protein ArtP [Pasteurella skyensis]|uniref:Arginine transport ATP-binding protein ArtP n=1 Tax=Phocoenobacter skyensis TaxID=97481 RepID=A0AAJ6NCI0_9PAST|nr:arginine ABC transporter ATP-binding protein ArtP [Pasteurella skyensis]MDP8163156.1 arginine ABC transporter ATP-binding protein ArtP [Pasteurella skyensis]MDP8170127.1 arginine ABC transporter ATP-binding protein ArtP [Pasteurella skyensis]MDP8173369.1 arginine ABC transporter ATP-binding protein ArtP [Pasteurella skyensis]MDP8174309.1 arginine ABC transporter ATP-binding protein ArtP [Pasteurella skyensis]MDP8179539.1 arginine ABC transporter ATP-binding protein ArtP [Pasteurella skyensi
MAIQINNVNFFYGSTQALFDINLNIEQGDTVVLLGPSGAGKSTLIRTLNLIEAPKSGILKIGDRQFDLANKLDNKQIALLRREVGMVFQQYHLWPHLNVMQNLTEAPMKVLGLSKTEATERATGLLSRLHLKNFADRFPLQLSGGQQQRVAIARALMMRPEVLLFDEPTAALDPEITAQIIGIIKELTNTGITQVVVTHEVSFAKKIATKVVYMEQGKVIEFGDSNCFNNPKTSEFAAYLSH